MPDYFEITVSDYGVRIGFIDPKSGMAVEIEPLEARQLAAELMAAASDVEELRKDVEQMMG